VAFLDFAGAGINDEERESTKRGKNQQRGAEIDEERKESTKRSGNQRTKHLTPPA